MGTQNAMTSQQHELLRQEILDVFPKNDPPDSTNITVDDLGDSPQIRDSFNGIAWWLASNDILDRNADSMPLLTPEAFHHYLPAFLLRSLEGFERSNETLLYTVFSLSPTKTSRNDPRFRARLNLFSPQQVSVVRKFLQLILADETMYNLYESAERALRKFWIGENP
jgi:hypothetical protein